jgi:hypothetical protein
MIFITNIIEHNDIKRTNNIEGDIKWQYQC